MCLRNIASILLLATLSSPSTAAEFGVGLASRRPFVAGEPLNNHSYTLAASPDGRFLVFESFANDLIPGLIDVNEGGDIYVLDRTAESFDLITRSVSRPERAAYHGYIDYGHDYNPGLDDARISDDGRWVAFSTQTKDLVPGATYSAPYVRQVFLFDRVARVTRLVSHAFGNALTAADEEARLIGMSADGRFVAFDSEATNLAAGNAPKTSQVYLFDRDSDQIRLASRSNAGASVPGNGRSTGVELSPDGAFLAFNSGATNLVAGQLNGSGENAFVFARQTGQVELISRDAANPQLAVGGRLSDISPDGRFVTITSGSMALVAGLADGNGEGTDCFQVDRQSGSARLVSRSAKSATVGANDASTCHRSSRDGRYVFFGSAATDLVAGFVDNNGWTSDVFLSDAEGSVKLISHRAGHPTESAEDSSWLASFQLPAALDDRYEILLSSADDLIGGDQPGGSDDFFLYDVAAGESSLISRFGGSSLASNDISSFGKVLLGTDGSCFFTARGKLDPATPATENPRLQIFRADTSGTDVELVSRTPLTGTGVDFESEYSAGLLEPSGRYIGRSRFLVDMATGKRELISHLAGSPGVLPNGWSSLTAASSDGRFVLYGTAATNVAAVQDSNGRGDVYVYDRETKVAYLVSHAFGSPGITSSLWSSGRWISEDGQQVVFGSGSQNLVPGYSGPDPLFYGTDSLYFYDRRSGAAELINHHHASIVQGTMTQPYFDGITPDGLGIYFHSGARDLVAGFVDRNSSNHNLYFYDRTLRRSTLIDHRAGSAAEGSAGEAFRPLISADGSAAFFSSNADDLVPGQVAQPGVSKIYRWNRATNLNELAVHAPGDKARSCTGTLSLADITPDGRWLLLTSTCRLSPGDTNDVRDVYLFDRLSQTAILISHLDDDPNTSIGVPAYARDLSADARRIIYTAGSDTFSYDRSSRKRTLLSLAAYFDPEDLALVSVEETSQDGVRVMLQTSEAKVFPLDGNATNDFFYLTLADLFADGFESGDTSAWSQTLP
jgi:Tol biopolymer transport system component